MFGGNVANERTVRRWFERFRSGDFSLENKPLGRPATKIDNHELKAVLEEDTSQTTPALSDSFHSYCIGPSETDRNCEEAGQMGTRNVWQKCTDALVAYFE